MKKIININLNGRVIPIEDSAYEQLQAYIESLRRYFAKEESRDEIINDIESRIAELLHDKIRKGANAITDGDIEEVASSMGRPEDFDAEEASNATDNKTSSQQHQQEYTYTNKKSKGRLYRDSTDKFIGGVCSGIAAYLNIDPAIIRILFAIVTFGGFGLGFLVYILLWIILPEQDIEGYSGKRLYRNPEERMLGGVAGGLAAYFDKSVSMVRLIFAGPIVLSILLSLIDGYSWRYDFHFFPNLVFGSLSGTFILAYIVLWIVLPEAHSTYEKMEMRGEKVDVNTIRQNVKDGADNVKERMKNWGEEVKESAQNFSNKAKEFASSKGKTFATEVNQTARHGGRGIGHAIGVLFKVFFLFIAGTIAFALFVAVIALIFGGVAWWPVNNFLWTSNWQQVYAWGTLIFFLGVPLIGFIIWVIRRILRVRSRNNYLGWTFGFLWTVGWVAAILLASSLTKDFREYEFQAENISINQPARGKMIIAVSAPELEYTGRFDWLNDDGEGWDLSADTLKLSTVKFNVKASADSAFHVVLKRCSFGRSEQEALARAEKIQYAVYSRDSVLDLASGYSIAKESKFRGQQVEIEIHVPVGKKIRFDESVTDKLNPVNFRVKKTFRRRRGTDIEFNTEYSFRFRTDVDYVMGLDGTLRDADGNSVQQSGTKNENGSYRYDENNGDREVIDQQLEEAKRDSIEASRKLKRLQEQKQQQEQKPVSGPNKIMIDEEEDGAGARTEPVVISLTPWLS